MNSFYAKTLLYAYPCLDKIIEQIDELVLKKALNSKYDFSPCLEQCEKIVNLTDQKDELIILKDILDKIIKSFNDIEYGYLDYKYFSKKLKKEYNFNPNERNYFRKQNVLLEKFIKKLEKKGYDDKWFKEELLSIDFFNSLLKRVIEREENQMKNFKAKLKFDNLKRDFLKENPQFEMEIIHTHSHHNTENQELRVAS